MASIITLPDGTPITQPSNFCNLCKIIRSTEKGSANCIKSDAVIGRFSANGPIIQSCKSGGLWDAVAAIIVGGQHIASWLVGQARDKSRGEDNMLLYAKEIGADESEMINAFHEIDSMTKNQFEKVANMLYTLANQLSAMAYQNLQQELLISEREKAEREVQKLNEELEKRVEQRTMELQIANDELESFSYSVSHDLRAPLRSIDGFSFMLMEDYMDELNDQAKKYLEKIRKASQRMAMLIDDMLKLSRLTRGELRKESFNISQIALNIVEEIKAGHPKSNIKFIIQKNLTAHGEKILIDLVLENLFGNAFKFTSNIEKPIVEFGLVNSEILSEKLNLDRAKQVFFVKDNGAGFDMKYSSKLFGPFQRLHRANEFEGNGIGLTTVQRIITKHGGRIWAESKVNKGATFYFTIDK
jgi:light-regulated signal transduction histidine kinase (bacteriophytochrome)